MLFLFFFFQLIPLAAAKKVAVKEVVFDSPIGDLVWLGKTNQVVLCRTQKGRLYRSSNGGEVWNDITDSLYSKPGVSKTGEAYGGAVTSVDQLLSNPNDKNSVLVVGSQKNHFLSEDGGLKWRVLKQKSQIHSFLFHPTKPKWALLSTWTDGCAPKYSNGYASVSTSPCQHLLYITKDSGRTFQLVTSYVVQFNWGDKTLGQEDRVYFTHFRSKSGDQPKLTLWSHGVDFSYSDDGGASITRVIHQGNKFLLSNGFLFVAMLKDAIRQTVALLVSTDGGLTFLPIRLPVELEERSYTILDTSEGAVMLHVNHGESSITRGGGLTSASHNLGHIYISDASGVKFSLSLPNNLRSISGECEFDKVLSLEGVYLANFKALEKDEMSFNLRTGDEVDEVDATSLERAHQRGSSRKGKDESEIRTVVSFDKGGVWSYLKPPKVDSVGAPTECLGQEKCWLHLHGVTNFKSYPPFYSIESAVGLVMGTGNVGASLRFESDQVNTYLSRDGGLTWSEAHKGAFIYEFGDHGGLLVMADDVSKTRQVVFSWNEGLTWYDFEIAESPLDVDNIVTEPNSTTTKFMMYGTRGEAGVLYHLDFDALGQKACKGVWAADSVSSDYESWTPTDGYRGKEGDKCLLGKQVTYTRRKQSSECYNGEEFERPVSKKNCVCSIEDFECEIGFSRRVGSTDCRPDSTETVLTDDEIQCTSGDFYWANAYRKVVGDTCVGGWAPTPVQLPCPSWSRFSWGAWMILGLMSLLVVVGAAFQYVQRNPKLKHLLGNVGLEGMQYVQYSTLMGGAKRKEEREGEGFGPDDFMDDPDEFDQDAPKLSSYGAEGGAARRRGVREPLSEEMEDLEELPSQDLLGEEGFRSGGLSEATQAVPRLLPPGARGDDQLL